MLNQNWNWCSDHEHHWNKKNHDAASYDMVDILLNIQNWYSIVGPWGWDIDGLVQEWCNSSALAMELCIYCTNPLIGGAMGEFQLWLLFYICHCCDICNVISYLTLLLEKTGDDLLCLIMYRWSHCEETMVTKSSYGISYAGKLLYLYWIWLAACWEISMLYTF